MNKIICYLLLAGSLLASTAASAGNKLFVGNLPFNTTSEEVGRLVMPYGAVTSMRVRSVDADGKLFANATIEYELEESVDAAIEGLHGFIYDGQPLRAKKAREIVVVGSKVKEEIREAGLRSDGDLVQAVSDKVHEILQQAIVRAGANKRGTVRPYDL